MSNMSYHRIQHLIDQPDENRVKGLAENVYIMTSLGKETAVVKFSVEFCKYLKLQGYEYKELLLLVTDARLKEALAKVGNGLEVAWIFDDSYKAKDSEVKVAIFALGLEKLLDGSEWKLQDAILWAGNHASSGVYFVGNVAHLLMNSDAADLHVNLTYRDLVGQGLRLKCENHGTETTARTPSHFASRQRCFEPCNTKLPCGHFCLELCHLENRNHERRPACNRPCDRVCENGHKCALPCNQDCELCKVEMTMDFDCGHSLHFLCFQGIPDNCDDLSGATFTACGHPRRGQKCDRKLKCPHQSHKKEGRLIREIESTKIPILRRKGLNGEDIVLARREDCRHFTRIDNFGSIEKAMASPCNNICRRSCSSLGHPCVSGHPCSDPCPPCEAPVRAIYSKYCYHSYVFPCHESAERRKLRPSCPEKCRRNPRCYHPCELVCGKHVEGQCPPCQIVVTTVRSCGHEWTHPCHVTEMTTTCLELVDKSSEAICGHGVSMECWQVDELHEGEASLYCKSKCSYYFDPEIGGCGHYCQQNCQVCMESGIHGPCLEPCNRVLFCGHKCEAKCGQLCPPCHQPCESRCEHGKCVKFCGLACDPCQEPCSYGCPHGKCTRKCGEPCNKQPCMETCFKTRPCGHNCSGFCGEPCPSLCLICDQNELLKNDMLGKTDLTPTDRLISLQDCGHVIDAEALAGLMNIDQVEDEIGQKSCPICRKVIRTCPRFKVQLLSVQGDVTKIKEMILGTESQVRENYDKAFKLIKAEYEEQKVYDKSPFPRLLAEIVKVVEEVDPGDPVDLATSWKGKSTSLLTITRIYRKGVEIHVKAGKIPDKMGARLRWVLEHVMEAIASRPWPMTEFQMKTVLAEWDRAVAMNNVYSKQRDDAPAHVRRLIRYEKGTNAFQKARNILDGIGPYGDDAKQKFEAALKELEAALETKLGISEDERIEVVKAFGSSVGRWFKCPAGHIYVVTECGGVTEVGRCNECGALVGGENHSILSTNDLAAEMDGATEPLYPTALFRHE